MYYVLPYIMGSNSARELARGLGTLRITGQRKLAPGSVIINWGNSNLSHVVSRAKVLNNPASVGIAINKLKTLTALSQAGIVIPDFTVQRNVAQGWVDAGAVVYARQKLTGSGGEGIVVYSKPDSLVVGPAPLYTKQVAKCFEYRLHIMGGKVIDYVMKRRRNDTEVDEFVRNHEGGWVFCRDGIVLPHVVMTQAIAAINTLGLDFGAVDCLYSKVNNSCHILEINTAPGLEGKTISSYVQGFKGML